MNRLFTSLSAITLAAAALCLSSCSSVKTAQASVAKSMKATGAKVKQGVTQSTQSVRSTLSSLTGPDIKIVQVDPNKLKKLELGKDQLAAYTAKQRRELAARRAAARSRYVPMPDFGDPEFYSLDGLEPGSGMLPGKPGS